MTLLEILSGVVRMEPLSSNIPFHFFALLEISTKKQISLQVLFWYHGLQLNTNDVREMFLYLADKMTN